LIFHFKGLTTGDDSRLVLVASSCLFVNVFTARRVCIARTMP